MNPENEWVERARDLAKRFAPRAQAHDREGSFPFENFAELREAGFYGLTVPRAFGGAEAGLGTYLAVLEELARADGSTALAFMMHLKTFGQEREAPSYPPAWFERLCRGAVERGELVNTVATEEGLGSPSGGGVPDTFAVREGDGWVLRGRKTFTTLAPVLHAFIVLARLEGEIGPGGRPMVGNFLVFRGEEGLRVEETWDSLGMRATGSHDVVLDGVRLPADRLLNAREAGSPDPRAGAGMAWFALGLCAVTIGVASAARDYAVAFARERVPNSQRPIREFPGVRTRVARIELLLQRSRALTRDACGAWERRETAGMPPIDRVAAAKVETLNACIEAVDLAMRVVGGVSLQRSRPLERYWRDVRAPLHNPPLEDRALEQLARRALDDAFEAPKGAE
ncbi:acyl-CoA dehydrogenase family protein [Tepidiforma sp.]|uniref:acyl-CoA dehydrogenase family protein n=1 Tax=Tepidiforma sp. TaxID=2682230 RepID=UPI002ADDF0B2|nr:acyl-CoA dehydrogenase family protein [Tepidiforma sp.]